MLLTNDQFQSAFDGAPVRITDPSTLTEFVLIRADKYAPPYSSFADGLDGAVVGALIEEAMREEDAGDPLLELYQKRP